MGSDTCRRALAVTFVFGPDREDGVHHGGESFCLINAASSAGVDSCLKNISGLTKNGLATRGAALAIAFVFGPNRQDSGCSHGDVLLM